HQTFDISIVALSRVVQRGNALPKRHNAAQQRHNVTNPTYLPPERGTENPQRW
ncbi:hypothetical protein B0H10DRAFT_2039176, partial [Mycena sp. CBHHK59/15]